MGSTNQGARHRRDDVLSLPDPPVILKGPQNYLQWRRAMKLELERIGMLSILDETVRVPA
ncbi:hypothetical protein PIB30_115841, partial [Stylosanthes scabra]|nr:hypothetical protein [Stylosanthes scabra]